MVTTAPVEVEQFQQQRDGGDLVRLGVDGDLAEDQPGVGGPGADQVQGRLPGGGVDDPRRVLPSMATTSPATARPRAASQRWKHAAQGVRVEPGEDAAEGVVGGDAVGQVEEAAEEVELGPAVALDLGPAVGPGQGAAQGQDDDIQQGVMSAALDAGIGQCFKERCKQLQSRIAWHALPPASGSVRPSILRRTP